VGSRTKMARIQISGLGIEYQLLGPQGAPAIALTPGGRFAMDSPGLPELAEALVAGGKRALHGVALSQRTDAATADKDGAAQSGDCANDRPRSDIVFGDKPGRNPAANGWYIKPARVIADIDHRPCGGTPAGSNAFLSAAQRRTHDPHLKAEHARDRAPEKRREGDMRPPRQQQQERLDQNGQGDE